MLDQLRQIAVFAKTVEAGSFRAAARDLRLSPSVVSHHVAQLEDWLGAALLYRSTRRLSLTREGEQLFQAAQAMIAAAEEGIQAATSQAPEPVGELRVTAPAVLSVSDFADDIADFTKAFPKIRLVLSFTDRRLDMVQDGIDVAIRMGWLRDSALKARKLYDARRLMVAARSYIAERKPPRTPKDLETWDWLELSSVPLSPELRKGRAKPVTVKVAPRVTVDDAIALHRLVRAGVGVAILPELLVESDLAQGVLETVLPDWQTGAVGIYAVWHPNTRRGALTSRFVDFLAERAAWRRSRPAPKRGAGRKQDG